MQKPASEPAPRPAVRNDVRVEANRCPYCRDDVEAAGSAVCESCLTRHHPACWDEAGSCSSCQGNTRLAAQRPPLSDALISEALAEHGYPASEVLAYLTQDRPRPKPCTRLGCERAGTWVSGQNPLPHCEQHARENQRGALRILVGLIATFAVIGLAVTVVMLGKGELRTMFPIPVFIGCSTLMFGMLAENLRRKPARPIAPDDSE